MRFPLPLPSAVVLSVLSSLPNGSQLCTRASITPIRAEPHRIGGRYAGHSDSYSCRLRSHFHRLLHRPAPWLPVRCDLLEWSSANPSLSGRAHATFWRMAYVQHVGINQRHQRQHHSLSGLDTWAGQQEPIDYSLPYPPPPPRFRDDIQSADRYHFDQAVLSPRSRAPEKMRARESLPSRGHHREPAAASRREGKEPMAHRSSDHRRGQSSRVRSRSTSTSGTSSEESSSKIRSRSLSISSSESESASKSASGSESVDSGIATPKSAHEERSASESRSASSSSEESEEESSSDSSEEDSPAPETPEEKARRRRREKAAIQAIPEPKASSSRRHGHERGRKAKEPVIHEVESDASDAKPRIAAAAHGGKVLQKRRHKHHSPSKAASQRHHRHREHHGEIRPASSSKRYLSPSVFISFPWVRADNDTFQCAEEGIRTRPSLLLT